MPQTDTNLFVPFKALGLICSSVPAVYVPPLPDQPHDGFVCCALDNVVVGYQIGRRLRVHFSTEPMDEGEIALMTADQHRKYVGFANKPAVCVIQGGQVEYRLFIEGGGGPKLMLSLTTVLLVVDKANTIHLFDVENGGEHLVELSNPESFDITAITHPITYMNKILIGAADGRMRLWNFRTGRLVHEFPSNNDFNSPILVLEQSPAIDVIGIGLADGRIHLRNIKFDKLICTFRQSGQITALAFRTDGVDTLVSANSEGSLAVWDLNERQLLVHLPGAHSAPIHWLHFMAGQPYLISAGNDNRIVKWFFRNEVAVPEVDTALEGHAEPASVLRFCSDQLIVSACRDGHVRRFDTAAAHRCVNFGMAREVHKNELNKDRFMDVRLNPIVQMELSHGREAVWDNMICRHEDSPLVSTWSTRLGKRGSHLFCHERFSKDPCLLDSAATSLFISCCGTFALIGYSSGHVDVWNMQSGQWKFSFEAEKGPKNGAKKKFNLNKKHKPRRAHPGAAVTGLALDLVNRNAVSGASDGTIHFWRFQSPAPVLRSRLRVAAAVTQFRIDPMNSLLAVGLRNGEVGVLDVLCRRIARRFFHSGCIDWTDDAHLTALEFSNDGKWLISADNLGFLKVWDLPTGSLIDVMRFASPCIGLSMGENDDYLATCHQGQRAVYLWANKSMFLPTVAMASRSADELHDNVRKAQQLPTLAVQNRDEKRIDDEKEEEQQEVEEVKEEGTESEGRESRVVIIDEDEEEEEEGASMSNTSLTVNLNTLLPDHRDQLDPSLYTLSGLAPARWASLPYLELIRERNKPVEAPKKPEKVPFFLPSTSTLQGFEFDSNKGKERKDEDEADGRRMEEGGGTTSRAEDEEEGEGGGDEQQGRRVVVKGVRRTTVKGGSMDSGLLSRWTQKLMSAKTDQELCDAFAGLRELSLSALDFQIRALSGTGQLAQFVAMLVAQLAQRRDFDLVQSWMAAFLNIHHRALWSANSKNSGNEGQIKEEEGSEEELMEGIKNVEEEEKQQQRMLTEHLERLSLLQSQARDTLQPLFDGNMAVVEFTKGALT